MSALCEQRLWLRWHDHDHEFVSAVDSMLRAEALVDCTLVCHDTTVRAHKVVLAACRYFVTSN